MKHIFRILLLAVTLVTGLMNVSAQTVQVMVTQKVPSLPSSATNYLDDPFRYFNIQLILAGGGSEGVDVFFDMNFSLNEDVFYIRTKSNKVPTQSIHLSEGVNIMKRDEMVTQIRGRMETNVDFMNLSSQLLPEGTYTLCLDVYLWSDRTNPSRIPISDSYCPSYEVCYSGSAPELVSPLAGAQMALNGAMVVSPARKIKFFWTPVISNCASRTSQFKYKFKVVKVMNGQNYQDAIRINPTVFSAEVRNGTYAELDTLRDIKVQMEKGVLYVAQVQAEQIITNRSLETLVIANDGKSQPMPFYWCYSPDGNDYDYYAEEEDGDDDDGEASDGLTQWEGGAEEVSEWDDILEEAFSDDQTLVLNPKRHYVASDGYYTIPMTNDIEVGFLPKSHQSLKDLSYTLELYDYMEGGIDSITSYEPLFSEKIDKLPGDDEMDGQELVNRTLAGWGAQLEQGSLYYLQLLGNCTAGYWNYTIADTVYYVNELLAEHFHDTVSRAYVEEQLEFTDGVFFQWGDDPDVPDFTTPQWKSPVNRLNDDIYDPANYAIPTSIPEVQKTPTFPVSWAPVKNVAEGDSVEYEVNVYELEPGQTVETAILLNDPLVSRTITDATEISDDDKDFFKVFSSRKTYVMTLSTSVDGESNTFYHFENGNEAMPIVFKIVK